MKQGEITFAEKGEYLEGRFYLDHSCDEWIIGNLENAKQFHRDLGDLIVAVEAA